MPGAGDAADDGGDAEGVGWGLYGACLSPHLPISRSVSMCIEGHDECTKREWIQTLLEQAQEQILKLLTTQWLIGDEGDDESEFLLITPS